MRIDDLQRTLGVEFKDRSLLEKALVHDSYVNENPDLAPSSNERLEFLGDSVLGIIVSEQLYLDFPDYAEGKLTHIRASLVRRDTLARMATAIGLGDYLYLGKGEETSGGRKKAPNLAGAIEAVIGAVYLDQGMGVTKSCVMKLLSREYKTTIKRGIAPDYKSRLQEIVQASSQKTPVYSLVGSTGPDHALWFTVEVRVDGKLLASGSGKNKKAAEAEAAKHAMETLKRTA